jgi:predicted dehydrogenase
MTLVNFKGTTKARRRLRLGMVGGGEGAFIGAIHRMAARLDDRYEFVAGALSSDPARARRSALDLGIAPTAPMAASPRWRGRRSAGRTRSMSSPS